MGGGLGATTRFALHPTKYSRVATIGAKGMATFRSLIFATVGFGFYQTSSKTKLPIGGRMGYRVGSKLCPLCHKLVDHEHVLRHCRFSAFIFRYRAKGFWLGAKGGGRGREPSRLLFEDPTLSLHSTQGLVLWAALKAQWALRCEARFQGGQPSLDDFVAGWMGILEVWRAEPNMYLSRSDLQHLLDQLFQGFGGGMFQKKVPESRVFPKKSSAWPLDLKEQKWGQYRDGVVERLQVPAGEQWTLVYTDGSAKQVRGWWQAGYGVWFGEADERNVGLLVPDSERQSVSRGELRGVLYTLQCRQACEKMVVVLDSEYVYKGIRVVPQVAPTLMESEVTGGGT